MIVIAGGTAQAQQPGRVYYASPSGGGTGAGAQSPFRVSDFWRVARPGDTLVLLDGLYTGGASMITPPAGLHGLSGLPITVRALHDGKVHVDGQAVRVPVELAGNDYFVIEGINASNSKNTVVHLSRSNHNVVRRVCAWEAADGNQAIFGIHYGVYNLLEDCAGWGTARKIFTSSQGGDYTTFRRCWGRWEGSHVTGPKKTFEFNYNAYHNLVENSIGTWDPIKMRQTYTLLGYDGLPWTGVGGGTYTNYAVQEPYGIFASANDPTHDAGARLYGCIAYTQPSSRPISIYAGILITKVNDVQLQDCLSVMAPPNQPFLLSYAPPASRGLEAKRLTAVGEPSQIYKVWPVEGFVWYRSIGEMPASGSAAGAQLQYRYVDGQLTSEPLWPWPMDQRIYDAMILAGYDDPVRVTQTISQLAGPVILPASPASQPQ